MKYFQNVDVVDGFGVRAPRSLCVINGQTVVPYIDEESGRLYYHAVDFVRYMFLNNMDKHVMYVDHQESEEAHLDFNISDVSKDSDVWDEAFKEASRRSSTPLDARVAEYETMMVDDLPF